MAQRAEAPCHAAPQVAWRSRGAAAGVSARARAAARRRAGRACPSSAASAAAVWRQNGRIAVGCSRSARAITSAAEAGGTAAAPPGPRGTSAFSTSGTKLPRAARQPVSRERVGLAARSCWRCSRRRRAAAGGGAAPRAEALFCEIRRSAGGKRGFGKRGFGQRARGQTARGAPRLAGGRLPQRESVHDVCAQVRRAGRALSRRGCRRGRGSWAAVLFSLRPWASGTATLASGPGARERHGGTVSRHRRGLARGCCCTTRNETPAMGKCRRT